MRSVARVIFRPSAEHATPRGVCDFFADVFAAQMERPQVMDVILDLSEVDASGPMVLDLEKGEPRFDRKGRNSAHGRFGGRWLAEHDVPLTLSKRTRFRLVPTDGDRVKMIYYKA